jgi:hypothetical protein
MNDLVRIRMLIPGFDLYLLDDPHELRFRRVELDGEFRVDLELTAYCFTEWVQYEIALCFVGVQDWDLGCRIGGGANWVLGDTWIEDIRDRGWEKLKFAVHSEEIGMRGFCRDIRVLRVAEIIGGERREVWNEQGMEEGDES